MVKLNRLKHWVKWKLIKYDSEVSIILIVISTLTVTKLCKVW